MPCTTILVGKNASYDGSTLMARNEDSGSTGFCAKKFIVVNPEDQPKTYKSIISKVEIELPDNPMRYTAMPNATPEEGIWAAAGVNEENVAMNGTETITTNPRVLGADPLVKEGIGEEDLVTLVLPYIHSAKEGAKRLGELLEKYGTYEMNGIGFQDVNEIWWLETIGGHNWIARRVPDDVYVVMPNQFGTDTFNFKDAYGPEKEHMCSKALAALVADNHLDLTGSANTAQTAEDVKKIENFNARLAFGSHSDSDHCYNTPRAWYMLRTLSPNNFMGTPEDDDLPWCMVPDKKITVEDVKYVLSAYYQGTPYNPYAKHGDASLRGMYRPIGINRNNFLAVTQLRPYAKKELMSVEWLAVGSNAFNELVPFYSNVTTTPAYLANTTGDATTEDFYWSNRLVAVMADAHYSSCIAHIERYQ
ncbi:MAG: C69 family dipeptidase, partial [Lachnospiraceae bacterium]|nr:C69 family dipeptidase [Lachnospiraceae bacterium]